MRKAPALAALAVCAGCAAPALHPEAYVAGQRFSEDIITSHQNGARTVEFGEAVGPNFPERIVMVRGHLALVRSGGVSSGFAWFDEDGQSVGHGHGGYRFFEVMPVREGQKFPNHDLGFFRAAFDAACEKTGNGVSRLDDFLERNDLALADWIETAEGGFYRLKGPWCPLESGLLEVSR